MHPIGPEAYLLLLAQDRERHVDDVRRRRIAGARADLVRSEARAEKAWRELISALDDATDAREALTTAGRQ